VISSGLCLYCSEPIVEGEPLGDVSNGTVHRECLIRMTAGSLGHQQQKCSCFGGQEEDPPGLTVREAARAAADYFDRTAQEDPPPADRFERLDWMERRSGNNERAGDYYDRNGLPLSLGEWARRIEDPNYKRVALTNFGPLAVSTVWLGMDHSFARFLPPGAGADRRPILFETMVFFLDPVTGEWISDDTKHELAGEQHRWHTLEDALAGHETVVQYVKDNILPPEAVESIRDLLTTVYKVEEDQ